MPDERIPIVRRGPSLAFAPAGADPIPVRHIIGVGRNYAEHAHEQDADVPERPMLFSKNPAAGALDGEPIVIPRVCQDREQVDFEGELAVVIGQDCRDVDEAEVLHPGGPVLGLCCGNDVSARWWQKEGAGGQFVRGKSFDTFCPLGPHVTPVESVGDPQRLTLTTTVGGERMQRGTTADMIFPIARLIAECSAGTTLLAGTVILTGTPPGVGHGRTPPRYLQPGETVRVEIESLGVLENPVELE